MKAWVLYELGNITCDNVDIPEITENEVLVKVKATGVCGSDIPRIYTSGTYSYPLVPGHEFSGQVIKLGCNVDDKWLNKRVGVFPLIPCRECIPCQNKQYEMCRKYSYLGSRRDGGFAEYVSVPQENLIELPENVTYEQAAMLEPMAVAIHSIRRVQVKELDSIVVCGMGTIGLFIVMFLLEQGVKNLFVIGNKEFQKNKVLELGVKEENYCDSKIQDVNDWLKTKSENYGFDVFFECVGKNETIKLAVDNVAPGGRVMLVGNPFGDITLDKAVYWKILRHQLIVTGTWNSSFTNNENDDWHYVIDKLNEKRIMPEKMITHKFTIDEIEKGYHIMRDKSDDYIKVMMIE